MSRITYLGSLFPQACLEHWGEESFAPGAEFRNALEHHVLVWYRCSLYLQHHYFLFKTDIKSRIVSIFGDMIFGDVKFTWVPSPYSLSIHRFIHTLIQLILTKCLLCARHSSIEWGCAGSKTTPCLHSSGRNRWQTSKYINKTMVMGGVRKVTGCCERVSGEG